MNQQSPLVTLGDNVTAITMIAPLKEGAADNMRKTLKRLEAEGHSALNGVGTIHFCRWVIFDNDTRMLFTSQFDGAFEKYVEDFIAHSADLDSVFEHCEGYPGLGKNPQETIEYIGAHLVPTDCFYAANPEVTVKEIGRAVDWQNKTLDFQKELAKPPPGFTQTAAGSA